MSAERESSIDREREADRPASNADAAQRLLRRPLTQEDLRAQTAEVARPLETESGARVSLLLVQCGGERLALPGSLVRRVVQAAVVHRVPHRSNAVLRGICNVGGRIVLAADLAALLELEPAAPDDAGATDRRMLLLGESPDQWVVEVDRVIGVARVDPEHLLDPPATVRAARDHLTEHLVEIDGDDGSKRVALLGGERLLAGLERSLA